MRVWVARFGCPAKSVELQWFALWTHLIQRDGKYTISSPAYFCVQQAYFNGLLIKCFFVLSSATTFFGMGMPFTQYQALILSTNNPDYYKFVRLFSTENN